MIVLNNASKKTGSVYGYGYGYGNNKNNGRQIKQIHKKERKV